MTTRLTKFTACLMVCCDPMTIISSGKRFKDVQWTSAHLYQYLYCITLLLLDHQVVLMPLKLFIPIKQH